MPENIKWTFNVQVVGGPTISESGTMEVEAYDKLQVTVAAGASDIEVDVQPGDSGQARFLLIKSDRYDASNLTYKVNASTTTFALDAPQILIGAGGVKLLNQAPKKLFFTNCLSEGVSIQILVGRDATP